MIAETSTSSRSLLVWVGVTRRHEMRSFWEQTGVLGPIYRLLATGLNDDDIALKLNLPREKVQGCIAWIVHFLELKNRQQLVLYASMAA
jgi:hypothetical protein